MDSIGIDNPDEVITWFAGYPAGERARKITGECPHACPHRILRVVGWGPDLEHYELRICRDICAGNCRGWCAPATYARVRTIDWKMLAPAAPAA